MSGLLHIQRLIVQRRLIQAASGLSPSATMMAASCQQAAHGITADGRVSNGAMLLAAGPLADMAKNERLVLALLHRNRFQRCVCCGISALLALLCTAFDLCDMQCMLPCSMPHCRFLDEDELLGEDLCHQLCTSKERTLVAFCVPTCDHLALIRTLDEGQISTCTLPPVLVPIHQEWLQGKVQDCLWHHCLHLLSAQSDRSNSYYAGAYTAVVDTAI